MIDLVDWPTVGILVALLGALALMQHNAMKGIGERLDKMDAKIDALDRKIDAVKDQLLALAMRLIPEARPVDPNPPAKPDNQTVAI